MNEMRTFPFDEPKARELLLLLAHWSRHDQNWCRNKLFRLAAYVDYNAYAHLGAPLTGATYKKKRVFGPSNFDLLRVERELVDEGRARYEHRGDFMYGLERYVAVDEPDLSLFNFAEINLVFEVVCQHRDEGPYDHTQLEQVLAGWELCDEEEHLPYESVFMGRQVISWDAIEWGRTLAKEHGWDGRDDAKGDT